MHHVPAPWAVVGALDRDDLLFHVFAPPAQFAFGLVPVGGVEHEVRLAPLGGRPRHFLGFLGDGLVNRLEQRLFDDLFDDLLDDLLGGLLGDDLRHLIFDCFGRGDVPDCLELRLVLGRDLFDEVLDGRRVHRGLLGCRLALHRTLGLQRLRDILLVAGRQCFFRL